MKQYLSQFLTLTLCLASIFTFGQGQTCATAEVIPGDGTYNATGPNAGGGCNNCSDGATNASWYTFSPTKNGLLTVSSCVLFGSETRLWLYEGTCGSLVDVEADSNFACGGFLTQGSVIETFLTGGTTYYLEWDNANDDGDFSFEFTYDTSNCFKPTNFVVDTVTTTSVTLDWVSSNSGNKFYIEYGDILFLQGTGTLDSGIVGTDGPSYTITGLDPNSAYDFYLWEKCNDTTATDTVSQQFVFTGNDCPAPNAASFDVDSLDRTYARITWDGNNTGAMFYFEYGMAGFTQGSGTPVVGTVGVDAPPIELTGLAEGTAYDYYYYEECLESANFTDTVSGNFKTLTDCNAPQDVVVSNVTQNSVDVDWTTFNDSSNYTIEYGPIGFTPGTGTTITDTITNKPLTIDFLSSGTSYDAYLYETCANVSGTTDSVFFDFATLITNDSCSGAITLMCDQTLTGSLAGATANDNPGFNCDGVLGFGPGAWYEFMGTGETININACATDYTPLIYVYTGSCGDLECLSASDADGSCFGSGSFLSLPTVLDSIYYIQIRTQFGGGDEFTLSTTCDEACTDTIANDICDSAATIALSPQLNCTFTSGDLQCATASSMLSLCNFAPAQDAFYTFETDTNPAVKITLNDLDSKGLQYALYADCSQFSFVDCGDFADSNNVVITGLTANTSYTLRIFNSDNTGGSLEVCVQPESTVGINEFNTISAALAPNPTNGIFNLTVNQKVEAKIVSLTGQTLKTVDVNNTQQFDLSSYASGVYLLELTSNNTRKVFRIIKE